MRIAAILLAAGASERFGAADKLLAPLAGRPLATHAARTLAAAPFAARLAVVRPANAALEELLAPFDFTIVRNFDAAAGQASSIAAGIRALPPDVDGTLIMPADMPAMTTRVVLQLIAACAGSAMREIVYAATAAGAQRNPVIFPRRLFPELTRLAGDSGAKALIASQRGRSISVTVDDDRLFCDVDTPADLAAIARDWVG